MRYLWKGQFLLLLLWGQVNELHAFTRTDDLAASPHHLGVSKSFNSSRLLRPSTSKTLSIRGGIQPSSPDNARGFWSTTPKQPTSFQKQSQSSKYQQNQQQQPQVTVTDVTEQSRNEELEATKEEIDSFLTRESRNSFIARVYAILTAQLFLTALSIFGFARYPRIAPWVFSKGMVVPYLSLGISTATMAILSFSERARRSSPLKWQLLAVFSITEAFIVGFITSFYKTKTVLSAAMSTAVATMSITMYTFMNKDSKRDLSQWGAGLSSMGMIFVFYGLIHLLSSSGYLPPGFLPYNDTLYCLFGTSLFSLYLAYHTRLITSGKHSKYQLNEKDYVYGAVLLYNDIINMFLYLLRLLDDSNRAE